MSTGFPGARYEAERVGGSAVRPEAGLVATMQRIAIAWAGGQLGDMVDATAAVGAALPDLRARDALHALALCDAGERDAASARLRDACADDGSVASLDRNAMYLAALVCWAELAHRVADGDAARVLAPLLRPYASQFVFTGAAVFGPVAHALAQLALAAGDDRRAADDLAAAARMCDSMRSPLFAARVAATATGR